jgi:hypothetical protein
MANDPQAAASKDRRTPPSKPAEKLSFVQRLLRKLESKRRRLKREDPNIYPLY